MLKINLCCLLLCLLLLTNTTQSVRAQQTDRLASGELSSSIEPTTRQQTNPQAEAVKIRIAKLGVGANAKATIRLRDGVKVKGYIAQAGEDNFVVRDRKTNSPTTIRYQEVAKVEENQGHSTARNIAIGVGIGAGVLLAVIAISIASLD